MTNLEQVEKLREKTNLSYDEAKSALDEAGGDLLEALINLEKQGKVTPPTGGGYYNSEKGYDEGKQHAPKNKKYHENRESFADLLRKFGRFCAKVIHKGNINYLEIMKDGEVKTVISITVLTLLILCFFWVTIPLIIIGLFFGFRYRFSGPDLGKDYVNNAMDNAANTAENLRKSISGENNK